MSNERKLLIYRDSKLVQELSLKLGSLTIGREESCNLILDAESVSRLHAKISIQQESLYLENQSSTGQLFVAGRQVEFAEWSQNEEAKIGPFVLKWSNGIASASLPALKSETPAPVQEEEEEKKEENLSLQQSTDEQNSNLGFANDWAQPAVDAEAEPLSLAQAEENVFAAPSSEVIDNETSISENSSPDGAFEVSAAAALSAPEPSHVGEHENTRVSDGPDSVGILKIVQGETIGREIRLEQGFQWLVGRSDKCHVKVDNAKLSRQHFKIIKVAGRFRLQDLGSSNGTRLNGIAVTDAPLSPFDTIVSGPVEFQFLISQAQMSHAPAPVNAQSFESHETTQFAPPPMVYRGDGSEAAFDYTNASKQNPSSQHAHSATAASSKPSGSNVAVWWNELPKNKRLLYVGAVAVMAAVWLMPPSEEPTTVETPVAQVTTTAAPLDETRSADISPEFYLLNPEERRKVENSYARAQRARNASDWKLAVEHSKEVLKYVDRYKDIADILAESQTHFNDVILGAVTKDLKNSLDAATQTQEQVNLLIDAGKKAIVESRWTDAQEQCAKAVSLDPKNDEANRCYAAAYGQDANFGIEQVPETAPLPTDSKLELQADLERDLESKKQVYQAAYALEQDGALNQALDSYKFLLSQTENEIEGIALPGRFPASVVSGYIEKNTELKTQIEQRMKDIFFQYETDYRTQLVDAEQLIANQDYIRARETYDRILNAAPNYQDVANRRAELYRRMISEARGIYHEGLIYESVGDLPAAIDKYTQTKRLLAGIVHPSADEYFRKANTKLTSLVP